MDSLPQLKTHAVHLSELPSFLSNTVNKEPEALAHLDIYRSLIRAMTSPSRIIKSSEAAEIFILDFVNRKWQTLTFYTQSKISEAIAPLSGDLGLVAEVVQRKHDFEKMQRTMLANLGSAKLLLGPSTTDMDNQVIEALRSTEVAIAGWASQLEKISSSLQGLLAIQESWKASAQATRTQNLTILAFIFIPISTVSSIYGMNTSEIQKHNPPTWSFGLAAAGVTVLAIGAACLYSIREAGPKAIQQKSFSTQAVPHGIHGPIQESLVHPLRPITSAHPSVHNAAQDETQDAKPPPRPQEGWTVGKVSHIADPENPGANFTLQDAQVQHTAGDANCCVM